MALPSHSNVKGNGYDARRVSIRFFPDGTSNPSTIYDPNNDVASVAFTSTGLWTVTLNYPVFRVLSAVPGLQLNTVATDLKLHLGALGNEGATDGSALTIPIACVAVATLTNITANANNSISLDLVLELNPAATG